MVLSCRYTIYFYTNGIIINVLLQYTNLTYTKSLVCSTKDNDGGRFYCLSVYCLSLKNSSISRVLPNRSFLYEYYDSLQGTNDSRTSDLLSNDENRGCKHTMACSLVVFIDCAGILRSSSKGVHLENNYYK